VGHRGDESLGARVADVRLPPEADAVYGDAAAGGGEEHCGEEGSEKHRALREKERPILL
jgi:hypothetical protein